MSIAFQFKLTVAGQAALFNASRTGTSLNLTHIQFGSGNRAPTGAETALLNPQQLAPIANGLTVSPSQIRMSAIFSGDQNYVIREAGLWAGSPGSTGAILAAYWSQATGDLAVKSAGVDFVFSHDMSIDSTVPGANLTIVADTAQAPLLALLAEHERKPDPHPQYLTEPRLRPLLERVNTTWSTSGVAPALSIAPATPVSSYVAGQRWRVRFHAGGTGNDTLSVSGLAGKSQKQYDAHGAKIAAVIVAGLVTDVEYDGVDVVVLDPLPVAASGRNVVINGDFNIWQRGTSLSVATAGSHFIADRWLFNVGASGNAATVSRQMFTPGQRLVPDEPASFLRYAVTSFSSGTPTIEQRIEGVRTLAGKTATLSFWAKADAARNLAVLLNQEFGTGGTASTVVSSFLGVFPLSSSWQKFVVTLTLPSLAGKNIGPNGDDFLQLLFNLPASVCTIDLSHVQLEGGASATPFEFRHLQQELALCQRYFCASGETYQVIQYGSADVNGDSGPVVQVSFPVEMRAVPTVSTTETVLGGTTTGTRSLTKKGFHRVRYQRGSGGGIFSITLTSWAASAEL